MIVVHLVDDDPGDLATSIDHPHSRRRDGGTVVHGHRCWLTAHPSYVHLEGGVHDALDGCHVRRTRAANLYVDHEADGRASLAGRARLRLCRSSVSGTTDGLQADDA